MSNISVIIPVHKFNDEYAQMLQNAIASVNNLNSDVELVIVGPKAVIDSVKQNITIPGLPSLFILSEATDYCNMVNTAVSKVKSPYFSVLEVDDVFTPIWGKNVEEYINFKPEVSIFMPLTWQVDPKKEGTKFIAFANEIAWAQGFADVPGYLSHDGLMNYYEYNMSGAVIKTQDFLAVGGLKPSIKIFFWYEFLLRFVENAKSVYVIPKIGYHHTVNREDSLMEEYSKTISKEEGEFWLEVAQSEYFFKDDRKKEYSE